MLDATALDRTIDRVFRRVCDAKRRVDAMHRTGSPMKRDAMHDFNRFARALDCLEALAP